MKKKSLLYLLLIAGAVQVASSCKKSFLDVTAKGLQLETNYYQTPDQAYAGLIAAYNPLGMQAGPNPGGTYADPRGPLNSAADECYTGGGGPTDMNLWQVWNSYTLTAAVGPSQDQWDRNYIGINRCNLLLPKIAGVTGLSTALQTRYIAELKCLRAYYYFDLVRLFGNIPLIIAPLSAGDFYTVAQAKPADVYVQIEKDLNDAIPGLPAVIPSSEAGRVSSGAAMAMLGKAILYQNNTSRMQEAAGWFEKVNASGVYALLPNFGDIFKSSNKFNKESIFEIYHAVDNGDWGSWPNFLGDIYVQMTGPRSYTGPTYWSGGWSFNPIIPAFKNAMYRDPRYQYTVADIDSLTKATNTAYTPGYANTGFFLQKFAPLKVDVSATGTTELNFLNDYIEIRLADTYLMEAEALVRGGGSAATAQSYLDKVRARVGLPSIPATIDNIYNERKLELATEGHRWFDLVRTGKAASVLAFKGFKAGTHELLPIPQSSMTGTKLVQNPGY